MQAQAATLKYKDLDAYTRLLNSWYAEEAERRLKNLQACNKDSGHQRDVLELISHREFIVEWLVDWCWTVDPRNAPLGLPVTLPWIPWPRQIEYLDWLYDQYLNRRSGLVEKSRDAGATWLSVALLLFEWRWTPGFAGGIGSNKLQNVDQKDNSGCVFAKMRQLLDNLPGWWLPKGFNPKLHDKVGNLVNPENGNNIIGQGGDDIGRGDRRSLFLVDEAAFLDHPQSADSALSQTTECQIDLSTPNGLNSFGQKRHSGRVKVFTFSWRDDPRKSQDWYEEQKKSLDPVIVAQEIDIDYHASVEGLFISPIHVQAAIDLPIDQSGIVAAGLDVAAGGANRSSLAVRHGSKVKVVNWDYSNGVDLAHRAIDECNKIGASYLNYDRIGVGHAVYSALERTERVKSFEAFALEAGSAPSETLYPEFETIGSKVFINAKAEWWYNLAKRFEASYEHRLWLENKEGGRQHKDEEMISIDNDGELIAQLSAPKKQRTTSGKIKVESKEELMGRGIQSPDRADALVMCMATTAVPVRVLERFAPKTHMSKFTVDPDQMTEHSSLICGIWVEPNMSAHCLLNLWNAREVKLWVFAEAVFQFARPEAVMPALVMLARAATNGKITRMSGGESRKDQWRIYGNKLMFGKDQNDMAYAYQQYGFYIEENPLYEESGSIMMTSRLLQRGGLKLHERCKDLGNQCGRWIIERGEPGDGLGLARCLTNVVSACTETTRFDPPKRPLKPFSRESQAFHRDIDRLAKAGVLDKMTDAEIEGLGMNSEVDMTKNGFY